MQGAGGVAGPHAGSSGTGSGTGSGRYFPAPHVRFKWPQAPVAVLRELVAAAFPACGPHADKKVGVSVQVEVDGAVQSEVRDMCVHAPWHAMGSRTWTRPASRRCLGVALAGWVPLYLAA